MTVLDCEYRARKKLLKNNKNILNLISNVAFIDGTKLNKKGILIECLLTILKAFYLILFSASPTPVV